MADEHQTSALVTYFVTKLKLYIKANGHNELVTEALEFYKNGMVEFHDEQNFQTKLTILKRQAIHDQLLEYIYRMGENTNLKENTMKKSELKALISEVIAEMNSALDTMVASQEDEKQNANKNAQRLIGKTITKISLDYKDGYMEIDFSDGTHAIFGEVDGIYSFEILNKQ